MDKYLAREIARRPAESLTASPTAHYGMAYRAIYMADLLEASANARANAAPYHRRHADYMSHARENANRTALDRWLLGGCPILSVSVAPPATPPSGPMVPYAKHPDAVTATRAFHAINNGDLNWNKEDLIQDGVMALLGHSTDDEALRFKIAKHAMSDAIDGAEVRERGRERDSDLTEEKQRERRARPGTLGRDVLFWDSLAALPPRQARALSLLRYCAVADVADDMGITEGAVEQLRVRGIFNIRKILGITVGNGAVENAVVGVGEIYGRIGDAA